MCAGHSLLKFIRRQVCIDPPWITVLMLSAAELWRSGADDKYHTLAAANLLHIADAYWLWTDRTDRHGHCTITQTLTASSGQQHTHTHTHTHPFNGSFSRTTRVSRYQKGKTNLDFTEARGSGISGAMCKSASRSRQITMPAPHHSSFFTGRMPFLPPNQQRQSTEGN